MTRLEQATHLSQIIGAAAVVLSLVYVGNQISDNTTEVRANAARELTGIGQELDAWVVTSPDLADIMMAGNNDYEALSVSQRLRLNQYVNTALNLWEQAFRYRQDGLLNEEGWAAWDAYFLNRMRMGFGWPNYAADDIWRLVWRASETAYSESFRSHVNSLLTN